MYIKTIKLEKAALKEGSTLPPQPVGSAGALGMSLERREGRRGPLDQRAHSAPPQGRRTDPHSPHQGTPIPQMLRAHKRASLRSRCALHTALRAERRPRAHRLTTLQGGACTPPR